MCNVEDIKVSAASSESRSLLLLRRLFLSSGILDCERSGDGMEENACQKAQ